MPPQSNPQHQPPKNSVPIDGETLKAILEQQNQKLALDLKRATIDEKRIDTDAKLAEKSMNLNFELLKNEKEENRKTAKTYAIILCVILCLVFSFILACLYLGKQAFVALLFKNAKEVVIAIIAFFAGKTAKIGKKGTKGETDVEDAAVVS